MTVLTNIVLRIMPRQAEGDEKKKNLNSLTFGNMFQSYLMFIHSRSLCQLESIHLGDSKSALQFVYYANAFPRNLHCNF